MKKESLFITVFTSSLFLSIILMMGLYVHMVINDYEKIIDEKNTALRQLEADIECQKRKTGIYIEMYEELSKDYEKCSEIRDILNNEVARLHGRIHISFVD